MTDRLRKAWAVLTTSHEPRDGPSIYFAPTRAKARAAVIAEIRDAWGCTFMQAVENIRSIRREPSRDVLLPLRHPLAQQLGDKLLHIVVHAYGGIGQRAGYRDYFYTRSDDAELLALAEAGLFSKGPDLDARRGADTVPYAYFLLTDLGKLVAAGEQPDYHHA